MRLLFLLQANVLDDQRSFHAGAQQLVVEGALSAYMPYCYYGEAQRTGNWSQCWQEVHRAATQFQPDFVFLQFFHGPIGHVPMLMERLRQLPNKPIIATSCGDPYHSRWRDFRPFPSSLKIASSHSDLLLMSQMGEAARAAEAWGARNIVLWPHSCCHVRFKPDFDISQWKPEFDLVFIGSNNRGRNVFSAHNRAARQRHRYVKLLTRRYGTRFGLFGKNWDGERSWQGAVPFDSQISTMRRARAVFGGYPYSNADFYLSDRPFIAMGSGVPLVDFRVPRIEQLFRDGEEWHLFSSADDLYRVCDRVLDADPACVRDRAAHVTARIFQAHTPYHRLRQAVELMTHLAEHRRRRRRAPRPHLAFLNDQEGAVMNWVG